MKILIQRVSSCRVVVNDREVARIGRGLLLFVGVEHGDGVEDARGAASKLAGLRVFSDDAGKMNLALSQVGGAVLVVSQFTLAGSLRRGSRPSFDGAAPPDVARPVVAALASSIAALGVPVEQGVFGADMLVELCNDGPVTFLLTWPAPATHHG